MRSPRRVVTEIIAALMWGPHTIAEITEIAGCSHNCVGGWLVEMRRSDLVCVVGYHPTTRGPKARIYALQAKPFALDDTPLPKPTADAIRQRLKRRGLA
jgi:hypothetical protein